MAADSCPYCGTLLTSSLRFCVNCRRSVTEDKIKQSGVQSQLNGGEAEGAARYKLSRTRSYEGIRQARTVFTTISTLIGIFLVYFFVMKFVLHQPVPFENQLSSLTDLLQRRDQTPNLQQIPQTDPTAQPAPPPVNSQ